MKKFVGSLLAIAIAIWSSQATAQWRTKSGDTVPESEQVKSIDGFAAMLILTSDANWMDEWNTPTAHEPSFTSSKEVSLGGELHVLTVLSNPKLDPQKNADVTCDFQVQRPDGSYSIDVKGMDCFKTRLESEPKNLYMTSATLKFVSESSDQKGTYKIVVTLYDKNRGVSITLSDAFVNK